MESYHQIVIECPYDYQIMVSNSGYSDYECPKCELHLDFNK